MSAIQICHFIMQCHIVITKSNTVIKFSDGYFNHVCKERVQKRWLLACPIAKQTFTKTCKTLWPVALVSASLIPWNHCVWNCVKCWLVLIAKLYFWGLNENGFCLHMLKRDRFPLVTEVFLVAAPQTQTAIHLRTSVFLEGCTHRNHPHPEMWCIGGIQKYLLKKINE